MNPAKRLLLRITLGSLAIGSLTAISERLISKSIDSLLPEVNTVKVFSRPGTITLLSTKGKIIQKLGSDRQDKVNPGEMPILIKQAFVAAEDRRFYKHQGVDLWGIARAMTKNLQKGAVVEGASTITQQLARIIFLSQERTVQRKFKEIVLALKLERNLTKDEILEQYINNVYLGSNAYGISDAAWIYFKKKVNSLSLEEAALIAGLAPAPSIYSPLVNSDFAIKRRSRVLKKMHLAGFITKSDLSDAINSPLILRPAIPKYFKSEAPFFTTWVQQELPKILSKEQLEIGGLRVKTSLNLNWQKKAQKVLGNFNPENTEGALTSIETKSGLVRVLVGGRDFEETQFNRATQAQRSPGSTFKIVPFAAALEKGFKPEDIFFDTPRCWYGYCPQNFGNKYLGEVSMTEALTKSLNTVAVDIIDKVGFESIISIANKLGIGSEEQLGEYYPLAIGAYGETLLNMTSAYAAIANRGIFHEPSPFEEIRGPDNTIIWSQELNRRKGVKAVSKSTADQLNRMLRKVVNNGSGAAASIEGMDVIGKTGTSEGSRDLWFIGSIPQLSTGVWFGHDDNSPTKSGSGDAAMAWKNFIEAIKKDLEILNFP